MDSSIKDIATFQPTIDGLLSKAGLPASDQITGANFRFLQFAIEDKLPEYFDGKIDGYAIGTIRKKRKAETPNIMLDITVSTDVEYADIFGLWWTEESGWNIVRNGYDDMEGQLEVTPQLQLKHVAATIVPQPESLPPVAPVIAAAPEGLAIGVFLRLEQVPESIIVQSQAASSYNGPNFYQRLDGALVEMEFRNNAWIKKPNSSSSINPKQLVQIVEVLAT